MLILQVIIETCVNSVTQNIVTKKLRFSSKVVNLIGCFYSEV